MKPIRNLFLLSIGITIAGFFLDSDPQKGGVWFSIFEFTAMTLLTFGLLSIPYFTYRKVKQVVSKQ